MSTLVTLLARAERDHHNGIRLLDRHEQECWWSWAELGARAHGVARRLVTMGVSPGEVVALVYPTEIGFVDAFFGVVLAGAVPAPLAPPLRLGQIREQGDHTVAALGAIDASLVLGDPRLLRLLATALRHVEPRHGAFALEQLPQARTDSPLPALAPEQLALIQLTSGSTSRPRPVALTHRALAAQTQILNGFWPSRPGEEAPSGFSWLPLYHDMGLVGALLAALERPGTVTLLPPERFAARPASWLRGISRYRATVSAAPDFGYAHALRTIRDDELEGVDLSCWQLALDGAEPIDPRTLEAFASRFSRWGFRAEAITPVYGLAEAALAVSFSPVGRGLRVLRVDRAALADGRVLPSESGRELPSLGPPVPGVEIEIRAPKDQSHDLGSNQVGEVWVSSPSLMEGYLGLDGETSDVLRAGWLRTGDLGFLEGGELYLVGRSKDVLIVRGHNHDPGDLEIALRGTAGVRAGGVVAFAAPGPSTGGPEQVVVLLEIQEGLARSSAVSLAEQAAAAVAGRTGLQPDTVEVLEAGTLPRTSSGKIQRGAARSRWQADGFIALARWGRTSSAAVS